MKCTSCGANIPKGALFCTTCGAAAPKADEAPAGTPCPQCGANVPAGNLLCTVCGAKAAPVQQPRQPSGGYSAVPYPGKGGARPCPVCGKSVPEGYAFCTGCGTPTAAGASAAPADSQSAAATIVCWSCGAVVPASNRFCTACGADMDEMPTTGRGVRAAQKQKKSHTGLWITLICILIAAIAAFAVLFFTGALDDVLGVDREDTEESDRRDDDDEDDEDTKESAAKTEESAAPSEEPEASAEPSEKPEPDYLLPDSATRALTEADLEGLSWRELCLARNEIFARHGRIFKTPEIAEYFNSKDWYDGRYSEVTLSSLETNNVNFIIAYENSHFGGSYY